MEKDCAILGDTDAGRGDRILSFTLERSRLVEIRLLFFGAIRSITAA